MTERKLGRMVETIVPSSFKLPEDTFSEEEIMCADKTFDLFSRVKSTDQAEMITTVLFSYDEIEKEEQPTEQQIYNHVIKWKPHWNGIKSSEVKTTIYDLSSLGWIFPNQKDGLIEDNELF